MGDPATNPTPAERLLVKCQPCEFFVSRGAPAKTHCPTCSGSGLDPEKVRALEEVKRGVVEDAQGRFILAAEAYKHVEEGRTRAQARIRDLEAEVERLREQHHYPGSWPNCPHCTRYFAADMQAAYEWGAFQEQIATLRAEVEKKRAHIALLDRANCDGSAERDDLRAEVEKLRGLLGEVRYALTYYGMLTSATLTWGKGSIPVNVALQCERHGEESMALELRVRAALQPPPTAEPGE